MENIVIFSTKDSLYFAELIAKQLNFMNTLGDIERKIFGDREIYYRIGIDRREELFGKIVIFVASTNSDENLNELYRCGSAISMYGAKRIIFVIPFLGYSTMERAVKPGEVVTAKTIARQLSSIPNGGYGNTFLFMDLHVSGLTHYFEGDCRRFELYAEKVLFEAMRSLNLQGEFLFASADLGRPRWVKTFAKKFGTKMAFIDKDREFEKTKVNCVIGDVYNKKVIIYDDMTRSAGTMIDASDAYIKEGALEVYVVLSHCALNDDKIVEKIERSSIKKVIVTNTHPMSQSDVVKKSSKFLVFDVTSVFTKSIEKLIL